VISLLVQVLNVEVSKDERNVGCFKRGVPVAARLGRALQCRIISGRNTLSVCRPRNRKTPAPDAVIRPQDCTTQTGTHHATTTQPASPPRHRSLRPIVHPHRKHPKTAASPATPSSTKSAAKLRMTVIAAVLPPVPASAHQPTGQKSPAPQGQTFCVNSPPLPFCPPRPRKILEPNRGC